VVILPALPLQKSLAHPRTNACIKDGVEVAFIWAPILGLVLATTLLLQSLLDKSRQNNGTNVATARRWLEAYLLLKCIPM
jgi:hypothetical protein